MSLWITKRMIKKQGKELALVSSGRECKIYFTRGNMRIQLGDKMDDLNYANLVFNMFEEQLNMKDDLVEHDNKDLLDLISKTFKTIEEINSKKESNLDIESMNEKIRKYMCKNKIGYIKLGRSIPDDLGNYDYKEHYTDFEISEISKIILDIIQN